MKYRYCDIIDNVEIELGVAKDVMELAMENFERASYNEDWQKEELALRTPVAYSALHMVFGTLSKAATSIPRTRSSRATC